MNYTLKNESIAAYNESNKYEFPKYTSQLINWAIRMLKEQDR